MACPITVAKFVGTVSLGLLTGLSYSSSTVTVPSLKFLPTSSNASRSLTEVKRLNRKHTLRLTNLANGCLIFAYTLSPKHRKHPYLLWMCLTSVAGSYGVDYWYHRRDGFTAWVRSMLEDVGCLRPSKAKKDEDLVVVESEEDVNGESVKKELDHERRMQRVKSWFSGIAFTMGIVGLWGDKS